MLKKALYIFMALLFGFFIYNSYIKKESKLDFDKIKESIETDNIKYIVKTCSRQEDCFQTMVRMIYFYYETLA